MKTLCLLLSIISGTALYTQAQPYEGTFTYNIAYEVVDKDRTDLEIYKNMVPSEMKMFMKGPDSKLQFTGGMTEGILGDILYKSAEKKIYSVFPGTKTYTKTSLETIKKNQDKLLKAKKTDSTQLIVGVPCTKYYIKDSTEGTETVLWCAKNINNTSSKIMSYFLESMTEISVAGMEGLPLKIEFRGKEFNLTLLTVSKETKPVPSSVFIIPKEYKLSKADPQLE